MYVCICKAVTDRQIHEAVQGGACSLSDLQRDLGVSTECGRCASCARDCIKEARQCAGHAGSCLQIAA